MKELYRGPKPFSELMKRVPVKTSSELAFHLGRLRLVKKFNGSYILTDTGKRLVEIAENLCSLGPSRLLKEAPSDPVASLLVIINLVLLGIDSSVALFAFNAGKGDTSIIVLPILHVSVLLAHKWFWIMGEVPFLINLPAFAIYVTLLPSEQRGRFINRLFYAVLFAAVFLGILTNLELLSNLNLIGKGIYANASMALGAIFTLGILIYYYWLYRRIIGSLT